MKKEALSIIEKDSYVTINIAIEKKYVNIYYLLEKKKLIRIKEKEIICNKISNEYVVK